MKASSFNGNNMAHIHCMYDRAVGVRWWDGTKDISPSFFDQFKKKIVSGNKPKTRQNGDKGSYFSFSIP